MNVGETLSFRKCAFAGCYVVSTKKTQTKKLIKGKKEIYDGDKEKTRNVHTHVNVPKLPATPGYLHIDSDAVKTETALCLTH